jgi:hypothetical protein
MSAELSFEPPRPSQDAVKSCWEAFCQAIDGRFDDDDPDRLISFCSDVIRLEPDFAPPYIIRASVHLRKGRYDEAIADLS